MDVIPSGNREKGQEPVTDRRFGAGVNTAHTAVAGEPESYFSVFRQGFDQVSMDDLAKESEYTKRTIYRYFTCKEDLLFAVALRGYKTLFAMMDSGSRAGKTGLEKIQLAYEAYYEFFRQTPQMIQMINMTGAVKSASTGIELAHRQDYVNFDKQVFETLIRVFMEGKKDGSIRGDIDISKLAISSIFLATGFFQLLSMNGKTYTNHFKIEMDDFAKTAISMLIASLSGNPPKSI